MIRVYVRSIPSTKELVLLGHTECSGSHVHLSEYTQYVQINMTFGTYSITDNAIINIK